jgi:hypothetical protein
VKIPDETSSEFFFITLPLLAISHVGSSPRRRGWSTLLLPARRTKRS